MRRCALVLLLMSIVVSSACPVEENQPAFKGLRLPYGISIDVPTSWIGFPPDMKRQIDTAAQGVADLSGLKVDVNDRKPLLDIRQPLKSSYARLILNVWPGDHLTQKEVSRLTKADLKEVDRAYRPVLEKVANGMGLSIVKYYPLERRKLNGKYCLLYRFLRTSPTKGEHTYVEMYQIHLGDKSVVFSLEYREGHRTLWEPICRRSLNSLVVK